MRFDGGVLVLTAIVHCVTLGYQHVVQWSMAVANGTKRVKQGSGDGFVEERSRSSQVYS